jgi:predicted nucleic acid-binding protein
LEERIALRAVLDTSALLSREKRSLLYYAQLGLYTIVWSNYIIWELGRKMAEIGWGTDTARSYIEALSDVTDWCDYRQITGGNYENWLADPDDHPIMATALAGQADVVVTWNTTDFPPKKRFAGITIVTPDTFLAQLARSAAAP